MKILGHLESCQFYHIYQGVGTQHGGRAPHLRKLTSEINAYCLSRALPEPGVFKGIRFRLPAALTG